MVRQRGDIAPSDDPAASFSVVLEHPSDYSYVKTLIVPPCRESEARRILAQRH